MEFNTQSPIYLQIADRICEQILSDDLLPEERLSSVRELAVQLEVNPNTIVRSYAHLEQNKYIYKRRGIGYFVLSSTKENLSIFYKKRFINKTLPSIFKQMEQLDISIDEIIEVFNQNNKK